MKEHSEEQHCVESKCAPLFSTASNQARRARNKAHRECQHHLLEVLVSRNPFFNGFDSVSGSVREVLFTNRLLPRDRGTLSPHTGYGHTPFLAAVDHVTDLHVEAPVFCYQAGTGCTLWKNIYMNMNYLTHSVVGIAP